MIPVKQIDTDLSLKLGDPVNDNGDGAIWDKDQRLRYISRAYGRLCRNLQKIMIERQPGWSKKIKTKVLQFVDPQANPPVLGSDGSNVDLGEGFTSIHQVYVQVRKNNASVLVKATWFDPDKYLDVVTGNSENYKPNYDNLKFYYTVMNNKLQILPKKENGYLMAMVVFRGEPEVFKLEDSIDITTDYVDLLTVMAAKEGMEDLARADKVQLYRQDYADQLKIEQIFIEKEERDEGIHT